MVPPDGLEPPTTELLVRCSDDCSSRNRNRHTLSPPRPPSCRLWTSCEYSVLLFLSTNWATGAKLVLRDGFEPPTFWVLRPRHSGHWTNGELAVGVGLEPTEHAERVCQPKWKLLTGRKWRPMRDSNPQQIVLETSALTNWANEAWWLCEDRMSP